MDKLVPSDAAQERNQSTDCELIELSAVEREQVCGGMCDAGWIIIEK